MVLTKEENKENNTSVVECDMVRVFKELEYCEDALNDLKKAIKCHLSNEAIGVSSCSSRDNHHCRHRVRQLLKLLSAETKHIECLFDMDIVRGGKFNLIFIL